VEVSGQFQAPAALPAVIYKYIYTYLEVYVCIVLFVRPVILLKHFHPFRDSVNIAVWIVAQTIKEMSLLGMKTPHRKAAISYYHNRKSSVILSYTAFRITLISLC
jgi:hypothetical protein